MLQGEKVTLRGVEREDLARLHALEQDVELVMLADDAWSPRSFASFEKQFEKYIDADDKSWFAIEASGKLIGACGLYGLSRREGTAECGIAILEREYLGQGYGREALQLLLDWAFRTQNWRRIWLETLAANERAIRSYRACGFVQEARLRQHAFYAGDYVDVVIMGLLRSRWVARDRKEL